MLRTNPRRADAVPMLASVVQPHRRISQGRDQRHSPMKRQDAAGTPRLAFCGAESSDNAPKPASQIIRQSRKTTQSTASRLFAETFLHPMSSKCVAGLCEPGRLFDAGLKEASYKTAGVDHDPS